MSEGNGDFSIGSKVWPGTSKLLEEMGELQQVLGKLMGTHGRPAHWDGTDLRTRLIEEMADVSAAIHFFQVHNFTASDDDRFLAREQEKYDRFTEWHEAGDHPPKETP